MNRLDVLPLFTGLTVNSSVLPFHLIQFQLSWYRLIPGACDIKVISPGVDLAPSWFNWYEGCVIFDLASLPLFGGRSAHSACDLHKSRRKTSIIQAWIGFISWSRRCKLTTLLEFLLFALINCLFKILGKWYIKTVYSPP